MAGSLNAMVELSHLAHQLSDEKLYQIFPVILKHLNHGDVPTALQGTGDPGARVKLGLLSLSIIRRASQSGSNPISVKARDVIARFCQQHWRIFLRWIDFFIDNWGGRQHDQSSGQEGADFREEVWTTLTYFFAQIVNAPLLENDLDSLPDLIERVVRLWLVAAETDDRRMDELARILQTIVVSCGKGNRVTRRQLVKTVDDPHHKVVDILFRTITRQSQQPQIRHGTFKDTLCIAVQSAEFSKNFFRSSLQGGLAITVLTSAMTRLSSKKQQIPIDSQVFSMAQFCFYFCALYLLRCFDECHSWITEALEGRLLVSMLKSRRFIPPDSPNFDNPNPLGKAYEDILDGVTSHLLYPDVLREVIRSTRTAEARELDFDIGQTQGLWDLWSCLRDEARRRKSWRSDTYLPSRYNICGNEKVN